MDDLRRTSWLARRNSLFLADAQNCGVRMVATTDDKKQARRVARLLSVHYADAVCALTHDTPLQLLVATILSAQCTDVRVNMVTPELFRRFPTAAALAAAPAEEIEKIIQSTGFFRAKARNIQACCAELAERYDGQVPAEIDVLVKLPGVGRKTANVVLGTAFRLPTGVVVDTHVRRLTQRLGLTTHDDPEKIERDLMALLPKKEWIDFSHRLIHHGRRICAARKPKCAECPLLQLCPQVGVASA